MVLHDTIWIYTMGHLLNWKKISFGFVIFLIIAGILNGTQQSRQEVVFCDVGQGTATLFQLNSIQVLIDTGPDKKVLQCLGQHMPLFDKTIEYVIISHKQRDHDGGLFLLNPAYRVDTLIAHKPYPSLSFVAKQINYLSSYSFVVNKVSIVIHKALESSKDANECAYVVIARTPSETIFLASDINAAELRSLIPSDTTILEVPHHGSKYGLYVHSLSLAHPTLAVISVGKNNTYGHPAPSVLAILKAKKIKIWRTDMQGDLIHAL